MTDTHGTIGKGDAARKGVVMQSLAQRQLIHALEIARDALYKRRMRIIREVRRYMLLPEPDLAKFANNMHAGGERQRMYERVIDTLDVVETVAAMPDGLELLGVIRDELTRVCQGKAAGDVIEQLRGMTIAGQKKG